jgi:hypothetical protein
MLVLANGALRSEMLDIAIAGCADLTLAVATLVVLSAKQRGLYRIVPIDFGVGP